MNLQKLLSLTRQGIEAYNMINDGDRIAVGVSGGKDSLTLLLLMKHLQKFYPRKFDLMAITCDVGFEGMDFGEVEKLCQSLDIAYEIVHTQIADIAFGETNKGRPCSLCAKMRKGAMYARLKELGLNKMAYAHNKDDFIETSLMSLLHEGRFYAFPPVTEMEDSGITVIRPMIYLPENTIRRFAESERLPVVKNKCPVDNATARAYAKKLMSDIVAENPGAKDKFLHALEKAKLSDWPEKKGE